MAVGQTRDSRQNDGFYTRHLVSRRGSKMGTGVLCYARVTQGLVFHR